MDVVSGKYKSRFIFVANRMYLVAVSPRARGSHLNCPKLGVPNRAYLGGVLFYRCGKFRLSAVRCRLRHQATRTDIPIIQSVQFSVNRRRAEP